MAFLMATSRNRNGQSWPLSVDRVEAANRSLTVAAPSRAPTHFLNTVSRSVMI